MKNLYIIILVLSGQLFHSQTDTDGIMMGKNNFCTGFINENSSWKYYWEGTFKRENLNLGTVSTQKFGLMGNYGISSKLNFLFNIPYTSTYSNAGTLIGQKGFQDLMLTAKYMPFEKDYGKATVSFYVIGSYTTPTTNYVADYLPLSIGLKSKTITLRLMNDLQIGDFFYTISGAFVKRYNIEIDRNAYYTTKMHYTNQVDMPNVITANARLGYRTQVVIAELVIDTFHTLGNVFDITSNNMPFPSNTMNMTKIGFNGKYNFNKIDGLSLIGGFNHVISGRNVGEANTFYTGIFYIINFNSNHSKTKKNDN